MAAFNRIKFASMLASSTAFTAAQAKALGDAIEASFDEAVVPGESHEAAPLRGAAADLS